MKLIKLQFLIFILIIFSCKKADDLFKESDMTSDSLMLKVEEVYSSSLSYRDIGIVRTNFIADEIKLVEKPFITAFSRSGLYRYEYYEVGEANNRYIIHRDETGTVRTWWGITEEIEIKESLSSAIAGATGVSSVSAFYIPSFLMPHELGFTNILRRLENKEIIGLESIERINCYKLTGNHDYSGDIYTIWIQKNNFLIKKIEYTHHADTYRTENTIEILPEINIEMNEDEFQFNILGFNSQPLEAKSKIIVPS